MARCGNTRACSRQGNKASRLATEESKDSILIDFDKRNLPIPRMLIQIIPTDSDAERLVGNYYQLQKDRFEKVGILDLKKQPTL